MYPLSKYIYTAPVLILLSIGLVIAQIILDDANVFALCSNWLFAGAISTGIWHITKRYYLCALFEGKSFAISWPILSTCMNFTLCHFPRTEQFYMGILLILAMLTMLSLLLSVWQETNSVGRHMLVGLVIGLMSTLLPHTLLWLLVLPLAAYHMRCWSTRNTFSTLTGAILGIWFVYCCLFFCGEYLNGIVFLPMTADQMILNYAIIVQPESLVLLSAGFGLWQWLFLGLIALLVIIYSISAMLLNAGSSIRAGASISLISTLSISMVIISFFDFSHLYFYISLLSLFLSIQLTIHQANLHSKFNEWWTIFIILAMMTLSALPLWF